MNDEPTYIKDYILDPSLSEDQRLVRLRVALGVGRVLNQVRLEIKAKPFRDFYTTLRGEFELLGYKFELSEAFWRGEQQSSISWYKPAWATQGQKPVLRFCLCQEARGLGEMGIGVAKSSENFPFKGTASSLDSTTPYFQMYERLRNRMTAKSSNWWPVYHEPSGANRGLFSMDDGMLLELSTQSGCDRARDYFLEKARVMREELEPLIDEAVAQIKG